MPLTIEVPDDLAERLRIGAAQSGEDLNRYAVAALRDFLDSPTSEQDSDAWWSGLTEEQRAEQVALTARSLADGDAGRVRPATEVYARLRAKHARPGS